MKAKIGKRMLKALHPAEKEFFVYDTETKGFFLRVHPSGNMVYYCQYGRGKKIKIGHVQEISPTKARDAAEGLLAEAKTGKDPIAEKRKRENKGKTLEAFLEDDYGPDFIAGKKTGAEMLKRLKRCFAHLLHTPLENITVDKLNRWRRKRLEEDGVSMSTVNREIDALKAAMRAAHKEYRVIDHDPLADLKRTKVDNTRVRYLADDEEARLLNALDTRQEKLRQGRENHNSWRKERNLPPLPSLDGVAFPDHLKPLVLLAMHTGARRGELFSLHWADIDLDMAILTVRAAAAKSGKTRHIPLNAVAVHTLAEWKKNANGSKLVFPGKNGNRLDNIKSAWEKLLALAEIDNFRFHDLRHHFASKLVMAGVDLNTVRELLGHADLKMTLRYAHLAPKAKAAAVAKLAAPQAQRGQVIPMTSYLN